jgi:hypothetical protein
MSGHPGADGPAPPILLDDKPEGPPAGPVVVTPRTDCTDAEKAADVADCAAKLKDFQAAFDKIKTQQFDALSKASFQHNLDVSAYEGQLQTFSGKLAQFAADVGAYAATLTGTYMTTAQNDEAARLDSRRGGLTADKVPVDKRFTDLTNETNAEKAQRGDLQAALDQLSKDILAAQKGFRCVPCQSLAPLRARVDALRARSNFTINGPSGPPGDPVPVPRLPQQPKPPAPGMPGPHGPKRPPATKVYPPSGSPMTRIDAGDAWPYVIPPEGCPRVCVRVVYDWSPKTPTVGVRHGSSAITFTHSFDHGAPAIALSNGLTATDIVVSDDHEQVFFTVTPPTGGVIASGALSAITLKDGPLTINLASPDPKTSLKVDDDAGAGLASLTMATLIAIDGAFAALPAATPSVTGFLAAIQKPRDALETMFKAFADRVRAANQFPPAKFGAVIDISAVAGPHGTPDPDLGAYWPYDPGTWTSATMLGELPYWFAAVIGDSLVQLGAPAATDAEAQKLLELQWALATLSDRLLPGGPSVP